MTILSTNHFWKMPILLALPTRMHLSFDRFTFRKHHSLRIQKNQTMPSAN
eukprot:UN19344